MALCLVQAQNSQEFNIAILTTTNYEFKTSPNWRGFLFSEVIFP